MFSVLDDIGPPWPALKHGSTEPVPAAIIENSKGRGRVVVLCDHASNRIPPALGSLGLAEEHLLRHIAWDPGALGVARSLARELDAPLVSSTVSRLVIDCNRDPAVPDSIVTIGEDTPVPGNAALSEDERAMRVRGVYEPFHAAAAVAIAEARRAGPVAVVSVHSFTPVFRGAARPWHVGVLFDCDESLSRPLLAHLSCEEGLVVGANEPYSPKDRVYHTLDRHAQSKGLPSVMIEIRNDLIATTSDQDAWGLRLAQALDAAMQESISKTGGDKINNAGKA